VIDQVVPGHRVVFKRNPDYWGADVPSMRGFHNYDRITIDYFLNANAQFEAFKKGLCSAYAGPQYSGLDPNQIDRDFDFPAAKNGSVTIEAFESKIPPAVAGFFFNTRREKFADPRVRRALSMLYDFGWVNKNVYNGQYHRTLSYWQGSELSALGTPADEKEKELLAPYAEKVLPSVMDGTFGAGGYASAIFDAGADVIALDRESDVPVEELRLAVEQMGTPGPERGPGDLGTGRDGRVRQRAEVARRHRRLIEAPGGEADSHGGTDAKCGAKQGQPLAQFQKGRKAENDTGEHQRLRVLGDGGGVDAHGRGVRTPGSEQTGGEPGLDARSRQLHPPHAIVQVGRRLLGFSTEPDQCRRVRGRGDLATGRHDGVHDLGWGLWPHVNQPAVFGILRHSVTNPAFSRSGRTGRRPLSPSSMAGAYRGSGPPRCAGSDRPRRRTP
jgi:hypothetical protein